MRKILFVCHGNICRSQMADSIASHLAALKGVSDDFYFDSAATSREEIGSFMYPPAQNMLVRENIPVKKHRARQITSSDLSYFDEIYYMDGNNLYNLRRMFPKYDFHDKEDIKNKVQELVDNNIDLYSGVSYDKSDRIVLDEFCELCNEMEINI